MNIEDLRFDPQQGQTIIEPTGRGYGYWAGGCKAFHDADSGKFYLFYRQRVPLERGRGGRCAVAESDDGIHFRLIWSAAKEDLDATSIEVGCPVKDPSGEWRLYVSYEVAQGGYWRVDVLRGERLAELDAQARRTVLLPFACARGPGMGDYGLSFIKDPVVYLRDGAYWAYCAVSPQQRYRVEEDGTRVLIGHDATMLLISEDGLHFPRGRYVFASAWHRRARRPGLGQRAGADQLHRARGGGLRCLPWPPVLEGGQATTGARGSTTTTRRCAAWPSAGT